MVRTSRYHWKGNGVVEWSHCTTGNLVHTIIWKDPRCAFPDAVPLAQLAISTASNDQHGFSPLWSALWICSLLAGYSLFSHTVEPGPHEILLGPYLTMLWKVLQETHCLVHHQDPNISAPSDNSFSPGMELSTATPCNLHPSMLSPKWMAHFWVYCIPNHFQNSYRTGAGERTVQVSNV